MTEKQKICQRTETRILFVEKKANKVEIKKAIEAAYSVNVESVNTSIKPGKSKVRSSKKGVYRGQTSARKKAMVTLAAGESINIFGEN
ncbi:MAG: 50S ribosomal protein L23 [Saprospiraceae bacterium]|nr:50S ribosomal protein L23 [Saprospiraceae bacterium]